MPNRRSIRLPDYDYRRAGWYFVTVCTAERACVFGEIADGAVHLNRLGGLAKAQWEATWRLRPYLVPDAYVIMPNHVHLLFGLMPDQASTSDRRDRARPVPTTTIAPGMRSPARSVPAIVGAYKSAVTRAARRGGLWDERPLWQERFHDRIVRDESERDRIRRYVVENPLRWHLDRYAP